MKNSLALIRAIIANRHSSKRILFVGHSYYHAWYLSREMRKLGWAADVVNMDTDPAAQMYYHGQDFQFQDRGFWDRADQAAFYLIAAFWYQIFSFANTRGLMFGNVVPRILRRFGAGAGAEIRLLRRLGKKILYANNGCLDGVSQTSFSQWQPYNVCSDCVWRTRPDVCSDERNLEWGEFRNELADYQMTMGGNRVDYNDDPRVHESPWYFCNDKDRLRPDLEIPKRFRTGLPEKTIKLYHAVGHFDSRSNAGKTIKSTHIYLPLIDRLKAEGYDVELMFFKDVPNTDIRYYQAQADIFLDMLTFGFFGSNVREAMMLGKPAICFLRPEWLESMRKEIPDYVDELPVVSATPETVYDVLKDLLDNPEKRDEIGRRSRAFALKWHASDAAAAHFDELLSEMIDK